jgi:hypothetical protein
MSILLLRALTACSGLSFLYSSLSSFAVRLDLSSLPFTLSSPRSLLSLLPTLQEIDCDCM